MTPDVPRYTCRQCGAEFRRSGAGAHAYCSQPCRSAAARVSARMWYVAARDRLRAARRHACRQCGADFACATVCAASRRCHAYCTSACRRAAAAAAARRKRAAAYATLRAARRHTCRQCGAEFACADLCRLRHCARFCSTACRAACPSRREREYRAARVTRRHACRQCGTEYVCADVCRPAGGSGRCAFFCTSACRRVHRAAARAADRRRECLASTRAAEAKGDGAA